MMDDDQYTLTDSAGNILVQIDNRKVSVVAEIKINEIKYHCQQAIEATGIGWMVERQISGGKEVPGEVKQQCADYRARSDMLEQQVLTIASTAVDDNDHAVCDLVSAVMW
jgi:uncharacterized protein YxjI